MVKSVAKAEFKNFVKGLITEASPLNFPEGASKELYNFDLNRDGTLERRFGFGLESEYIYRPTDFSVDSVKEYTPTTFQWNEVAGNPDVNFIVIQIGNVLYVHDANQENLSEHYIGSIVITEFSQFSDFSIDSVDGYLIVVNGSKKIAIVQYEEDVGLSVSYEPLLTRDVWGVATDASLHYEFDPSYRSSVFDPAHLYNLQNQSWGIPRKNKDNILVDPVAYYYGEYTLYPSNSEAVWPGLQFQAVGSGSEPFERLYANLYEEVLGATTKAAKGYYIIDVLNRGNSRAAAVVNNTNKYPTLPSTLSVFPADFTTTGAKCVSAFAGRVFYGGFGGEVMDPDIRSPNLSSFVFFSQLVKNRQDIIRCYQEGDPTSRSESDIVDTDGGFINIAGAQSIRKMVEIGNKLIVLAANGIWAITGGSDYGFVATNYRVDKISSFGVISANSVVDDGSKVFYWSDNGIYVITVDQNGASVQSLTETTIQTYYQNIDNGDKIKCSGTYDEVSKKIHWIYTDGGIFNNGRTKELILDLVLGSFYPYQVRNPLNDSTYIVSGFSSPKLRYFSTTTDVTVDGDLVVVGPDSVVLSGSRKSSGIQSTYYLVLKAVGGMIEYTFGLYRNQDFVDWVEVETGGIDADALLVTGEFTAGDSSSKKQVQYITTHMRRTENGVDAEGVPMFQSSCKLQSRWEFSSSEYANRWSAEQEVYRPRMPRFTVSDIDTYDNGFYAAISKTMLRGRGEAFSLSFKTSPVKDCRLIGWSIAEHGNAVV